MDHRLDWTLAACARILRPVVRLALAMGVRHAQLSQLMRDLMIEQAQRTWRGRGVRNPHLSQIAITTGLNRKAVTAKVRANVDTLPHTEQSAAAKTFTLWLQMVRQDDSLRRLPRSADKETASPTTSQTPSFESVARLGSRGNVHYRVILDELVRLHMVSEDEEKGTVELKTEAFVPLQDIQAMLAFLGDNARDHLAAAVAHVLGEKPAMLDQAAFANGLALEDCEQIQRVARERWAQLHDELVQVMTQAVDSAPSGARARMRVGIYAYYEACEEEEGKEEGKEEERAAARR